MGFMNVFATSLLALGLLSGVDAAPSPSQVEVAVEPRQASEWWFGNIERQGAVAFPDEGQNDYAVFRNVKDFGATGDGSTDDTEAINAAFTAGNRCGLGCDSTTNKPALVYFPPGTYVVSRPILPYYYTHIVGDLLDLPTLKAAPNFQGMAVIDCNPYDNEGNNWYTNQNNFFRQIRNFRIDLTGVPMTTGTGIHWQVSQATSLQNIIFDMVESDDEANVQQGIFMENGSGGWMIDLVFNGGNYGGFFGSQQFTARNLEFNNCKTAIYQIWNWVWSYHGLKINNCRVGLDLSAGDGTIQTVGSVIIQDSTFTNVEVGVLSLYNPEQTGTNGTLILDNVDMSSTPIAVQNSGTKVTILEGGSKIGSFVQGRSYTGAEGQAVQATRDTFARPAALVDESGAWVVRSKPQYADVPASSFVSVKSAGAKGDGETDDTAAIQAVFDNIQADQIVYFDHGAYILTDTVRIPPNVRVVGEMWPLIMAGGDANFQDQNNPKPMLKVGEPGDKGRVEMSDLMIETRGPQPGAILMEWNVEGEDKAAAGIWDVHFRIGGSAGTLLQSDRCSKTPEVTTPVDPQCIGAWMLLHVTAESSIYMENNWLWVSDHELDRSDFNQINIYNGRGILIESTKGAWLWGTASEHSVLYNYQIRDAKNVYLSVIQTETAYMQGNPDARVPFDAQPEWSDPDFSECTTENCARTWGMRIIDSTDIHLYGGGLYSFFNNYNQDCLDTEDCQSNMISVDNSDALLLGISTKASVSMIDVDGQSILHADNVNNFGAHVAVVEA